VPTVTEPGDRDERITALEADVAALQSQLGRAHHAAAAARVLARGADTDVRELGGEFRAFRDQNNRLLRAMREDLTDLRSHLDDGFGRIAREFTQVDRNFLAVTSKIDGVAAGLQVVTDLLTRQEDGEEPEG
jgi:hypothetical protein